MTSANDRLRSDALAIWQAGVDAVRAERLVGNVLSCSDFALTVCGQKFAWTDIDRIAVVGAGKAGAGMASAVEEILGTQVVDERVVGWVNVPADCVRPLRRIHLHAARPAGVNEPTEAGVAGALRILEIVGSLGPRDVCLVLISGGGSALLPAPVPEISLADKQAVTRFLMQSGATINELNAVRKRLSLIKGGGLARAIRAGHAISLIISDVIGDPLEVIASGPTVTGVDDSSASDPHSVLRKFSAAPPAVPQSVLDHVERSVGQPESARVPASLVDNHIIGNNRMAVAAASQQAISMGYSVHSLGSDLQGEAALAGHDFAGECVSYRATARSPICLIGGGETVVRLVAKEHRGLGGRNQQLVLAAVDRLWNAWPSGVALLSGGTDGEDGPTDAAGAVADASLIGRASALALSPREYLDRNDAYHFFEQVDGLIKTGPTHTNVMDLRVAVVAP